LTFGVGDRVYVIDEPEDDIFEGTVLGVLEDSKQAYVWYETDWYAHWRWVTFDELENAHDIMLETASWF
jgi:hypothetical protein